MASSKDYYAILGVPKTATDDEIKKAFRRLAHEHHPDKGGEQQKFKDVNEAYQVLGDKEKRSKYDQFGSAAFEQGGFGGGGPGGFGGGFGGFDGQNINFEDFGDLGDILGGMFGMGGGGGRRGTKRGADIETEITLDFLDAVKGVSRKISLYKHVPCDVCSGSGAEPGAKMEKCTTCSGRGSVQQMARTMFGNIQTNVTCPDCQGRGERPSAICKHCNGIGIERKTKELTLNIPAGINDGEGIQVTGEGEYPGPGGKPGNLLVRVHIKHHPVFSRDGYDVLTNSQVPFSILVLGGEVTIETVEGEGGLKIPEGTQPGTVFKIRNKGIPHLHGSGRGDQLVTVIPLVPKKLSKEQKHLMDELRKAGL